MTPADIIYREIYNSPEHERLCVFDLDSTLYNVSPRTQKILQDYAHENESNPLFKAQKERLKTIQVHSTDWGIRESLIREGIEGPLDFFESVRNYWRERFFSNHYLKYDKPYPGAIEFVQALAHLKIPIFYLTGRDRPDMFEGTVESLKQWGLPLTDKSKNLLMKPEKKFGEDEDYKVQVLKQLLADYKSIYFFENEPVIINQVIKHCPTVKIIFMDTVHSRREDPIQFNYSLTGHFVLSQK